MSLRTRVARWLLRGTHPRDPALAEWLGIANRSAAGVSVTDDAAMRVAAVYSCIRVLAETVAGLPLLVYRRKAGGGKERATDHWLYPVLHHAPNSWMTSFGWREMAMVHLCLRGATYARLAGDRRNLRLVPVHPDRIRRTVLDDSGRLTYAVARSNGTEEILLQEELLRIPFMTQDGIKPITPIQVQRESIGAAYGAADYGARFWANDARPSGGWIEMEGNFKDDDSAKSFRQKWQDAMSGENRHKTAFLPRGMKYHPLSLTMEDAQFLETRKFQRSEIAGIFRVPPHMIGDLDRSTNNNIEHQGLEYLTDSLLPRLVSWEQALSRALLSVQEQDEYFFEFLVDAVLRADFKTRMDGYAVGIQNGILSPNEARGKENLNPRDGGDTYYMPVNMAPSNAPAPTPPRAA